MNHQYIDGNCAIDIKSLKFSEEPEAFCFDIIKPDTRVIALSCRSDITTPTSIFLEYTAVTVEWSVTPTTIQDKYEITLNATFKTKES